MEKRSNNLLGYLTEVGMMMQLNPSDVMVSDALKILPPGAVFVIQGESTVSRLIGFWGLVTHFWSALLTGFKVWASHTGNYWGAGKNETIEAFAYGVGLGDFKAYLDIKHKVKVWYNKKLTVEDMQKMKSFDYAQIGKKYDYRAFANFVFHNLGHEKDQYICSEIVSEKYKLARSIPWLKMPSADTMPLDIVAFMTTQVARDGGWVECFSWNWE